MKELDNELDKRKHIYQKADSLKKMIINWQIIRQSNIKKK